MVPYFCGIFHHKEGVMKVFISDIHLTDETTEIVASVKGIKVSSPILGVIILVISLLFFYLYLVYVYPITEIF